ncbi:flagellar protein FliT [Bacillus sp. AFS040349]|uniref:flagellar protein FliT n=1 Tax=Bacillus sp. AFS040349 TaxID=2033502 RepID=UPI000BFE04D8|nr:flagellar protein FliT [Bacillus sp. AFS040349]PGT86415.1 flagellar protein FliT [Bacillus sp. AFS040349]
MSSVLEIYRITEQLFKLVEKPVNSDDREDLIDKLTSLLEERELIIKENIRPKDDQEKQLGEQIILWNKTIEARLAQLKSQIQQDMMNLKKAKVTNRQYADPYQDVSVSDGMFYDKRR